VIEDDRERTSKHSTTIGIEGHAKIKKRHNEDASESDDDDD
jgi:hypothetical protein